MKYILLSSLFPESALKYLKEMTGKIETENIKILLIENAADVYPVENTGFVRFTRERMGELGLKYDLLDLKKNIGKYNDLEEKISGYDAIWLGGGNTYYLREVLEKTNFSDLKGLFEEKGIVVIAGSAGAVVLCENIEGYSEVDDPKLANNIYTRGLNWYDTQIIPHWGKQKYADKLVGIKEFYEGRGSNIVYLEDGEALMHNDGKEKIIKN